MTYHRNRVDDDDVDERGIVRDGGVVRVPLFLTDSGLRDFAARNRTPPLHRPGSVRLSDEDIEVKERARDDWIARKRNAWQTPPAAFGEPIRVGTPARAAVRSSAGKAQCRSLA